MISISGLHEIKTNGEVYSWVKNRSDGTTKTKLDRVLATAKWQEQFPKIWAQVLNWIMSDHRPLLLHTDDKS